MSIEVPDLEKWSTAAVWIDSDWRVAAANGPARAAGIEAGSSAATALNVLCGLPLLWSRTATAELGWVVAVDPQSSSRHDSDIAKRLAESNLQLQSEVRRRRSLERQVLSVAEAEQRRISLELHDGLGQHLTGVAFVARALADALKADGHARCADAEWIVRLLNETIGKTRALARGMWPVSLERDSFEATLRKLAEDLEAIFGVSCTVLVLATPELPSDVAAHHLFRVLQEAATNAIKHGQARRLTFRIERQGNALVASVVNDGLPPSVEALNSGEGMGVIGMQLRADALGGKLDFEVTASIGGRVALTLPGMVASHRGAVDSDIDDFESDDNPPPGQARNG